MRKDVLLLATFLKEGLTLEIAMRRPLIRPGFRVGVTIAGVCARYSCPRLAYH